MTHCFITMEFHPQKQSIIITPQLLQIVPISNRKKCI